MSLVDTELYHHGIKGMRWGVRRTPEQLGHKKKFSGSIIKNHETVDCPDYEEEE